MRTSTGSPLGRADDPRQVLPSIRDFLAPPSVASLVVPLDGSATQLAYESMCIESGGTPFSSCAPGMEDDGRHADVDHQQVAVVPLLRNRGWIVDWRARSSELSRVVCRFPRQ
jgi:hypothetical protein